MLSVSSIRAATVVFCVSIAPLALADDIRFIDLTPKKYSGNESNLKGFGVRDMELRQEHLYSKKQFFRWEVSIRRDGLKKGAWPQLQAFSVHFEIRDRNGRLQQEEVGKLKGDTRDVKPGIVATTSDGGFVLALHKNIDLAYPEISYWFSDIEWKDTYYSQTETYNVAFKFDDVMSSLEREKRKKAQLEKQFVVTFKRPKTSLATYALGDYEGFLLRDEAQIDSVRFDDAWTSMIANYCTSSGDCYPQEAIERAKSGKISYSDEIRKACVKYGCLFLFKTRGQSRGVEVEQKKSGRKEHPCSEVTGKMKVESCKSGRGIFSKEDCSLTRVECHLVKPNSFEMEIQSESEILLIVYSQIWEGLHTKRVKFTIGDRVLPLEIEN